MKNNQTTARQIWRQFLNNEAAELSAVAVPVVRQLGGVNLDTLRTLRDVSNSPCGAAAGFSGFVYYTDTTAFWRKNRPKITALMNYEAEEFGDGSTFDMVRRFKSLEGFTAEQVAAPAVSLRKACARLIVAALSLIVAGLSVLIAAARLVERGRLFEVIAAALRGRAVRVQTVAARRAFVVRGRSGRAVAAARSSVLGRVEAARFFVRGRLDRVQTMAARRAFVVRGRSGRAVAAVRSSILGRIEAVRLFVADCLFSARLAYFRRVDAIRGRAARLITAAALFLLNLNRVTNRAAARLERA